MSSITYDLPKAASDFTKQEDCGCMKISIQMRSSKSQKTEAQNASMRGRSRAVLLKCLFVYLCVAASAVGGRYDGGANDMKRGSRSLKMRKVKYYSSAKVKKCFRNEVFMQTFVSTQFFFCCFSAHSVYVFCLNKKLLCSQCCV